MSESTTVNAAVVVGGFVNGLGLVRSLRGRGVPVAVVTTQGFDIAHRARGVDGREHVERLYERPEALFEVLDRRAGDWRGRILFPTNDEALVSLDAHRDELSGSYRLVIPPAEAIPYLTDKARMVEAATSVGLPLPRNYGPATRETLAIDDIVFPVVVKPDAGHLFTSRVGEKLIAAHSREELASAVEVFSDLGLEGQIFDLIPGEDDQIFGYCFYVGADGEPGRGITIRKIRQSPASFGISRVAEIVETPVDLRERTVELVRRIGLRGIAVAEFKRDARDGSYRFIELNGRSVIYNTLLARGGLDTVGLAWSDYVEGRVDRVEPTGWDGVWVHLHADVLRATLDRSRERHRLREYLKVYRRPKIFAVWSASDPRPFLSQWGRTLRDAPSTLIGGAGTP